MQESPLKGTSGGPESAVPGEESAGDQPCSKMYLSGIDAGPERDMKRDTEWDNGELKLPKYAFVVRDLWQTGLTAIHVVFFKIAVPKSM